MANCDIIGWVLQKISCNLADYGTKYRKVGRGGGNKIATSLDGGGEIGNFRLTHRISILRPDLDSLWNFEFIEKKIGAPHGIFLKKKIYLKKFSEIFLFLRFSRGHHGRASGSKNLEIG